MIHSFEAIGRKVVRGRTVQMVCTSEAEAKRTADRLNKVAEKAELELKAEMFSKD